MMAQGPLAREHRQRATQGVVRRRGGGGGGWNSRRESYLIHIVLK